MVSQLSSRLVEEKEEEQEGGHGWMEDGRCGRTPSFQPLANAVCIALAYVDAVSLPPSPLRN